MYISGVLNDSTGKQLSPDNFLSCLKINSISTACVTGRPVLCLPVFLYLYGNLIIIK
jgi:hypothetical protein